MTEENGSPSPPWIILLTAVPLAIALVVLQIFGPSGALLTAWELQALGPESGRGHIAGLITYATSTTVHVAVCLAAIGYYLRLVRRRAGDALRPTLALALGYVAAVVLFVLWMPGSGAAAGDLTFGVVDGIVRESRAAALATDASFLGPPVLWLGYFIPTLFGVLAVVTGAAAGVVLMRDLPDGSDLDWKRRFRETHQLARTCLYLLTLVLVMSTFTASLFFHLPVRLFPPGEAPAALVGFAQEMSVFWGAVYTLTLIAAVAPVLVAMRWRGRAIVAGTVAEETRAAQRGLLEELGIADTLRQQFELVITLLAPLIAGPLGNAFQAAVAG